MFMFMHKCRFGTMWIFRFDEPESDACSSQLLHINNDNNNTRANYAISSHKSRMWWINNSIQSAEIARESINIHNEFCVLSSLPARHFFISLLSPFSSPFISLPSMTILQQFFLLDWVPWPRRLWAKRIFMRKSNLIILTSGGAFELIFSVKGVPARIGADVDQIVKQFSCYWIASELNWHSRSDVRRRRRRLDANTFLVEWCACARSLVDWRVP